MTRLLAGQPIAAALRAEVAQGVQDLLAQGLRAPGLTAVLVGENPASQAYVGSKIKACAEAGLASQTLRLSATTTQAELLATIDALNADPAVDGILVQLPLPDGIDERLVIERIDPDKDVDGFHPVNVGRLWLDQPGFVSATPAGIIELLHRSDIPLAGKHAVIVGRSAIVGKPAAALFLRENCTVTVCHSKTRDLPAVTREADVLIAAIGRPAFLGADHVKDGAVVIDVGINRITDPALVEHLFPGDAQRREQVTAKGKTIVGDVDFTRVFPKASAITPVPGGVGLLTVAMVIANTLTAARRRQGVSG